MTSSTPAPGTDAPDTTSKPTRALAAELLRSATIPASTAVATGPKLPPYTSD